MIWLITPDNSKFIHYYYYFEDGCPMEVSRDCTNVAAATVVWPETEIDQVATVRCPCGPEGENPLPPQSVATRRCGGNYTDGAEWGPQMCTECQFSDSRLQLCALLEVCLLPL